MIVDLLVTVLLGVLNAILAVLPTTSFFSFEFGKYNSLKAADIIGGYIGFFDLFVPVDILFGCLGAILGMRVFIALFMFINWIWRSLPGKGT